MNFKEHFRTILEHTDYIMPDLFNKLKGLNEHNIYVHFTNQPTLSYNPKPSHHDPIGIYAFPKDYVLDNQLEKNSYFTEPRKNRFIFILKSTENARILNLGGLSKKDAMEILIQMGIDQSVVKKAYDYYATLDNYYFRDRESVGHVFWDTIEGWRKNKQLTKNSSWNALFKKTKYNTIYDPGLGIIHRNEPKQIIFLSHSAYEIVDVVTNKIGFLKVLKSHFPDFRIKTYKSFEYKHKFVFNRKDGKTFEVYFPSGSGPKAFKITVGYNRKEEGTWYPINVIRSYDKNDEILDINEIINKIREQLENPDNFSYRTNQPEETKEERIVKKIADYYNLKIDSNGVIIRKYNNKNGNYNVTLKIYPQSSANLVAFSLEAHTKQYNSSVYYYGNSLENLEEDTPVPEIMKRLFTETQHEYKHSNYSSRVLEGDLEFFKKRVFRLK